MSDVGAVGGDDDVAAAQDGGVAGEAVTGGDAHDRHQPAELGEVHESQTIEATDAHHVGVAGAPAPAFREEDDR